MATINTNGLVKEQTEKARADVLFVSMPFCDEYLPCVTLALFKSILARAGVKSRVQHEYVYFANRIGAEKYRNIMEVCTIGYGHDYFACETIFADAAHDGGPLRSFDEYIRWMKEEHLPGKAFAGDQQQETLAKLELFREARGMAEAYIEEAAERVRESGAKVVAFVSMYQQHNAMIALAKRLKREKNPPVILAGGANCEGDAGAALAEYFDMFDYVFTGEADETIAPICTRLLREGRIPDDELPPGVATHTRPMAPPAKITTDLDALPTPDFTDFFREQDALLPNLKGDRNLTLEASRGCWWAAKHPCRFCGLNGSRAHTYREKTTERLADELAQIAAEYPGAKCFFTDNVLSMKHQKHLPEVLETREAYRRNGLQLFSEIKSPVTEAELARLTDIGFFFVQAGIESFSDEMLRLMGKGVSAIRQVETLKHCRAHNVQVMWYLLLGLPGETDAMIAQENEVIPKIMHLDPPGTVAHMMYLRYNYYMDHPEDPAAPKLRPDRGYDFVFPDRDFIRRAVHLYAPEDEEELARYYDYRLLGPSYRKLSELSEEWCSVPQMLFMKDCGDKVKVLDTREIAPRPLYHLTGADADALCITKTTTREDVLWEKLSGRFSTEEIKKALEFLEKASLLLHIGDEYLALPVEKAR